MVVLKQEMKYLIAFVFCFFLVSHVQASSYNSVEIVFWQSIQDSDDPDMFRAYLKKYPDGEFALIAELKIKKLGGDKARVSEPTEDQEAVTTKIGDSKTETQAKESPEKLTVPVAEQFRSLIYDDGSRYVGEVKNLIPHGQGAFTYWNGGTLVGNFDKGLLNGEGTYTWVGGNRFIGEWNNGDEWNGTLYRVDGTVAGTVLFGEWFYIK